MHKRSRVGCRWPWWLFRLVASAEVVAALAQPVLAGGFLSGHYGLLALHQANATITGLTAAAMSLVGLLVWRPGGGPWWPAAVSAGVFGAEAGQIVLGYSRVLAVHIPLGVAIITALVLLLVWVWRPGRLPARTGTPRPGAGSGPVGSDPAAVLAR